MSQIPAKINGIPGSTGTTAPTRPVKIRVAAVTYKRVSIQDVIVSSVTPCKQIEHPLRFSPAAVLATPPPRAEPLDVAQLSNPVAFEHLARGRPAILWA